MTRESKNVAVLGFLCGIVGPLAGITAVYVFSGTVPPSDTSRTASAGVTFFVYCIYAVVVFGPIAGGFGGFATWLLMRLRNLGARRSQLLMTGTILGGALGLLTVPVTLAVFLLPLSLLRGSWSEIHSLRSLMDPTHPYFGAAAVIGAIVGCGMALIIQRLPAPQRSMRHFVA